MLHANEELRGEKTTMKGLPADIRTIHLIGICGTGMGTLAAMLQEAGYRVRGSDENVYPPMSTFLASRGIPIKEGYGAENLEPPPDLVVVGNVVRRDNPEAVVTLEGGLNYCSMPQALHRFFLNSTQSVVAAGTHGKTTTAALLVWLLTVAGMDPGCLVGGLLANFHQSYLLGTCGCTLKFSEETKDGQDHKDEGYQSPVQKAHIGINEAPPKL